MMMNKHDYCVHTIGKVIMELERCARASILTIELLEKSGKYFPDEAKEIVKHIKALCTMQDKHISPILDKEIALAMSEAGESENDI